MGCLESDFGGTFPDTSHPVWARGDVRKVMALGQGKEYGVQDGMQIHVWMRPEIRCCDQHGCLSDSVPRRTRDSFLGEVGAGVNGGTQRNLFLRRENKE